MSLAKRRKALGYSQESFAAQLGVDRTTVSRWERVPVDIQPPLRRKLARLLGIDLSALDALLPKPPEAATDPVGPPSCDAYGPGDDDDMIRREFLRTIAVTGALAALSADETEAMADGARRGDPSTLLRMNRHLWQVYQLARSKAAVLPIVREQLIALNESLASRSGPTGTLCAAAGDLFQLVGELAFDGDRHTDAAASYLLAATASRESTAFDLWACALVRHAYVEMANGRHREAISLLTVAGGLAKRGDSSLSTRQWVASVEAEAYAGLGDLNACQRALDQAEKVLDLDGLAHNGGWLRFDGSRLAEERGARYVQLGRLDLAEKALVSALHEGVLSQGQALRRRGAVLADLAAIGAKRRDPDQVVTYGREAVRLARETSSGYVARRLRGLQVDIGALAQDHRVAELGVDIAALCTT
ncbi:helix-turn-helix transcriptional regulator [Streptomyces sp. NPDC048361]|uniref:helix-turn-helix transcriptional regulator n=1 Tax=Streptomyces sp. NPDC048361 TaxID=3154720 RepID=UPI00341E5DEB